MSKKARFLSAENQRVLIKRLYQTHVDNGGRMSLAIFTKQVPDFMQSWRHLDVIDSYESLLYVPETELEKINDDFVNNYWPMFETGADHTVRDNTNWSVDDWRNMDTTSRPDTTVDAGVYRYDNTIPLYQRVPDRHYDRDNDGLKYRSTEGEMHGRYGDMSLVASAIDEPYIPIDDLDVPYYGQTTDDSSTSLIDTMWRTK